MGAAVAPAPGRLIQPSDAWMLDPGRYGGAELPGVIAPQVLTPAAVILPPDHFPPPGSQALYALGAATLVGPGPTAIAALPGTLTVLGSPQAARVDSFTCQVLNLLPTSLITFTLRSGGATLPGGRRQLPAAPLATALYTFPIYAVVGPGQTIDISVQVDDAGAYTVQAFYTGWVFPAAAMVRYYAAVAPVIG